MVSLLIVLAFGIALYTRGDAVLTSANDYGLSIIDLQYYEKKYDSTVGSLSKSDIELIEKKLSSNKYAYRYGGSFSLKAKEDSHVSLDAVYVDDKINVDLECGTNVIDDNEIIIAFDTVKAVANDLGINISSSITREDCSLLLGKTVMIGDRQVVIKGIEKRNQNVLTSGTLYSSYDEHNEYCYMNRVTFESIIKGRYTDNGAEFSAVKDENERFFDILIHDDSKMISIGSKPVAKNEIVLSSNMFVYLFGSETVSECLNKEVTITFRAKDHGYEIKNTPVTFVLVGIGEENMVNEETMYSIYYDYSTDRDWELGDIGIGVYTNGLSASVINEIKDMNLADSFFLTEAVSVSMSWLHLTGIIMVIFIIPLLAVIVIFQISFANQNLILRKREIGILKSFSLNNKEIAKVLIFDSAVNIGIAGILTAIASPFVIMLINRVIFVARMSTKILSYNPLYIFVLIVALLVIVLLCAVVNVKRLNKKSDIDIVYERE